jgi:hypothetical protein
MYNYGYPPTTSIPNSSVNNINSTIGMNQSHQTQNTNGTNYNPNFSNYANNHNYNYLPFSHRGNKINIETNFNKVSLKSNHNVSQYTPIINLPDTFGRNTNFSVIKYDLYIPGNEKVPYKEKFEYVESKHKDLITNYNSIIDALKEWQMFYIKIYNILNMPIPLNNAYNQIFNDKYKEEMLAYIESFVRKEKKFVICRENSESFLLSIKSKSQDEINLKQNFRECNTITTENIFIQSTGINKKNKYLLEKEKDINFTINGARLNMLNQVNHTNKSKNSKHGGEQKKTFPLRITDSDDEEINNLAPFSSRNSKKHSEEKEKKNLIANDNSIPKEICNMKEKPTNLRENENFIKIDDRHSYRFENSKLIQSKESFSVLKGPRKNKNPVFYYPCSFNLCFIPTKKVVKTLLLSKEIQTHTNWIDLDKLVILNQEYAEQLITYQKEKEESDIVFIKIIENLKEKIKHSEEKLPLYPEMIPPDQTLKIFLRNIFFYNTG